jgi:hypothetical protein
MIAVTQKREVGQLNGTPDKRLFWSIISDYDTVTALCELIDNAVDLWSLGGRRNTLVVDIQLDPERQLINVNDNAGGVSRKDLRLLIAPGGSNISPDAETIGIFGVGSKRAVVALAQTASIKTHRAGDGTFQIDITEDWLRSSDWNMSAFAVPAIRSGTTEMNLAALRKVLDKSDVPRLISHVGETYAEFLKSRQLKISVNRHRVTPIHFERWAFPRQFEPRRANLTITIPNEGVVQAQITGGLIRDRDPVSGNYGVYFYCNKRLVAKHLKVREVGYFISSEAGVPHPDASLCRVIVKLQGPAKLMPWNSSKTGINFAHPVFQALRETLTPLVKHYSSLSRRWKNDWDKKVFSHSSGNIMDIEPAEPTTGKRVILPELPKVNVSHVEHLLARNKVQIRNAPWTLGLIEAVAAVDVISRQKLETKNRISLILIDSNFEIALKEFLVHSPDLFPPAQYDDARLKELFARRDRVINEVGQQMQIPDDLLKRSRHYYGIRNKLIHERATVDVTDSDIENYKETIRKILAILFDLRI